MPSATRTSEEGKTFLHTWGALTTGDATGDSISHPGSPDRTVQFVGTFGTGTVLLEGSNDAVTWATLHDPSDNDISSTANLISVVAESPLHIRPRVTGADGATTVVVTLLSRSSLT